MGRLASMVRKDLRRKSRAPLGIAAVLAFPLVFSGLLAATFGGGGSGMPKVQLLVEDRDGTLLSGMLVSAFGSEAMTPYVEVQNVGAEGLGRIESDQASALLRIPAGFGADLIAGNPLTLELVRNPAQGILPEIAEQGLTVLVDLLSSASTLLREPLDRLAPLLEGETAPGEADVAAVAAAFQRAIGGSAELLFPPRIVMETSRNVDEQAGSSGPPTTGAIFLIVLPGISVWALFLVGDLAMRDLLAENAAGTLRRQLSAPVSAAQLVLAKACFAATLASVSLVMLACIGWAAAPRPVDLLGFTLLSMALVVAVTGFAATMYGASRNERQGATVSSVLLLIFAFLGGSFVQLEALPAALRRLSPLSPFYWGTSGYTKLIRDGAGAGEILVNVAVLAVLGSVLLMLGGALLRRRLGRSAIA